MHYYEVAPNKIIRANSAFFTYCHPTALAVGTIVIVQVGSTDILGIIVKKVTQPSYATKQITSLVDLPPLPTQLIATSLWLSEYYSTHLATVLQTILPRGIQKKRRERSKVDRQQLRDRTNIVFTDDQRQAIDTIEDMSTGTAILHGVTGSGKTRVYIELAERTLQQNRSVIVLVPEIALTSQLVDEFSHHFKDIVLTHSKQTEAERHLSWQSVLKSTTPSVVIGPRSALFLPIKDIGLIIIDEAHEPSFKQEQSPRYSALRTASVLATQYGAKLILGSATPLVADYYTAKQADRPVIIMSSRAQSGAVAPSISLVDMTKRAHFKKHRFLSDQLLVEIEETLANGNQALIFHNRRGSATTTLCDNCAWSATCDHCFTPLTLHADHHQLRCHICGRTNKVPTSCPVCHNADIIHKGIGTKLIENELKKLFPKKVVARFDGDSDTENSLEQRYNELYKGDIDIIVGTQVIAKGLDLPKLRTVGVIQADAGLSMPDFSAGERTFQLLAQVVGRVGRSHHPTSVTVQTYQPTHPAVTFGLGQDYTSFYKAAIKERHRQHFPPFVYLLKLTCIYKTEAAAINNARKLARELHSKVAPSVEILGPTPAFYERQHDTYRWQLILKSPKRIDLVTALRHVPSTHWQFELDPTSLI